MPLTKFTNRPVLTAVGRETVRTAARRMAENSVGTVVVVDTHTFEPVGILTDRDIAVRCIGQGLDPDRSRVSEIMSHPVHFIYQHVPLEQALSRMAEAGTRRLVVTGEAGKVTGIVSLDEILQLLASEVESVGRVIASQGSHVGREPVLVTAHAVAH